MQNQIEAIRGDTNTYNLKVVRNRSPVNLTNAIIQFAAKLNHDDLDIDAVIVKDATITGPVGGLAEITLNPSDTMQFPGEINLLYDVKLLELGGKVTTLQKGVLVVVVSVMSGVLP